MFTPKSSEFLNFMASFEYITFVIVQKKSLKILTSPDFADQRCAPLCVLDGNDFYSVLCGWSQV